MTIFLTAWPVLSVLCWDLVRHGPAVVLAGLGTCKLVKPTLGLHAEDWEALKPSLPARISKPNTMRDKKNITFLYIKNFIST